MVFIVILFMSFLASSLPLLMSVMDVVAPYILLSTLICRGSRSAIDPSWSAYNFRKSLIDIPILSLIRSLAMLCKSSSVYRYMHMYKIQTTYIHTTKCIHMYKIQTKCIHTYMYTMLTPHTYLQCTQLMHIHVQNTDINMYMHTYIYVYNAYTTYMICNTHN